jgi:uncharacterized membrane protein YphA (DoxX/SURF4 family)
MMKKMAIELICFLLVVLFLYTGCTKLMEYRSFTEQIRQSPLLAGSAVYVAWFVPVLEILTASALMVSRLRLAGLFASLILMAAFTIYIVVILGFSKELPCSCGGVLQTLNWREHLVFNLCFLSLAFTGVILKRRVTR